MDGSTTREKKGAVVPCVYFENPGKENTQKTLQIASQRVEELDMSNILVASTSGKTGSLATEYFPGRNLVIVSHSSGFLKPDFQQLLPEQKRQIEEAGAKVLTCQHALGGVGRAVRKKLGTYELEEIIAFTLRVFGQGTKVAIEIALMAADAGLISTLEPCMSIGGTEQGADTAILLIPAHAQNFFDLRVLEILAKPRLY
ncbi:MAG: pyruvate kinase alpha/beta domain-containing protein [Candidatus Aminicenantaceae bacterium]